MPQPVVTSVAPSCEVLRCLPVGQGDLAASIRSRGNVPVAFGADCIIELTPGDIAENWKAASALKREVAGAVAAELSHRLSHCDPEEEDAADHAGEAAACLFLSIHHSGASLDNALKGCRVTWDMKRRMEQVEYLG